VKYLTLLTIPMFVFAQEQTLTPSEHNSIHGYNHRPIVKMQKKRNMHKLHQVDEEEAIRIAKESTKEDVQEIRLTHTGNIMFYKVQTQSYYLEINAMDGSVIDKKVRK
jgi:uncharacterized membrane protein YkoI